MNITAVIPCKDRENVKYCVASIRACSPRPYCIVVDFGSSIPIEFPGTSSWLKVIRVTRETEMFHKARAINIGIRAVLTPLLCIVDADEIVSPNFFSVVRDTLRTVPNSFVMCKTYSLLKTPELVPFDSKGHRFSSLLKDARNSGVTLHGDGCCNGVSTKWAMQAHGYDESFVGYRAQDSDFALRAVKDGLTKVWVESKTSMVHLPHDRVGEYYSDKYKVGNKAKYKEKAKLNPRLIVVANERSWGEL